MLRSESIKELITAMVKMQAVVQNVAKDRTNPHFKSKYADLAACWDVARKPLTDNGLTVLQFPTMEGTVAKIETVLAHTSGEWVSETLNIPLSKLDAQGVGAAITYGRRFAFGAIVGLAPEDDDGNRAAQPDSKEVQIAELIAQWAADWDVQFKDCTDPVALETLWKDCKASCMKFGDGTQALMAVKPIYAKRFRELVPVPVKPVNGQGATA